MRLRVFLLPAAMLALMLFVSSYWLPQGTPQGCDSIWRPCLSGHSPTSKPEPHDERNKRNIIPDDNLVHGDDIIMEECPGQDFQVSRLYLHLNSALGPASDVLLDEYLSSWEELIKFMKALGPLVSFFSHKVQEKITLLRDLSSSPAALNPEGQQHPNNILLLDRAAYRSVLSMLDTELQAGVVDFHRHTPSGSRTLLRLHRSLLWLQLLLEKLQEGPDAEGQLRTPGELCREAYRQALAPHHPWLLRQAAEVAFGAMPARKVFLDLVCVDSQEEARPVMWTLIAAIRKVHRRTQSALEERGMLELP